jgi:protein phosphatase methylesterase 1
MVEGAAMASLEHMHTRLQEIPSRFGSIREAIEWSTGPGQVLKNEESAQYSVPAQLREVEIEIDEDTIDTHTETHTPSTSDQEGIHTHHTHTHPKKRVCYEWITDLKETEPYWHDWFEGLSEAFLSIPAAKLLVLASYSLLECGECVCVCVCAYKCGEVRLPGGSIAKKVYPFTFSHSLSL